MLGTKHWQINVDGSGQFSISTIWAFNLKNMRSNLYQSLMQQQQKNSNNSNSGNSIKNISKNNSNSINTNKDDSKTNNNNIDSSSRSNNSVGES